MNIVITGNLGFVGQETQKLLKEKGHTVFGFDLMDGCDIRNREFFDNFIEKMRPDRILHLAATARFSDADKDPIKAFETNSYGTHNIAKVADKYSIPLVYSSTGSVYFPTKGPMPITEEFSAFGNSNYGCSKRLGELYIQKYKMPWIILRYGHLYGREKRFHGLIGGYLSSIKQGKKPQLWGGEQTNDFAYVKDVALANLKALEASFDKWNQIYNIGTGVEISAEAAGNMLCEVIGYTGGIEKHPMRSVDPERFVYDTKKAEHMLEFKSQWSFIEGLKDMLNVKKKSFFKKKLKPSKKR